MCRGAQVRERARLLRLDATLQGHFFQLDLGCGAAPPPRRRWSRLFSCFVFLVLACSLAFVCVFGLACALAFVCVLVLRVLLRLCARCCCAKGYPKPSWPGGVHECIDGLMDEWINACMSKPPVAAC